MLEERITRFFTGYAPQEAVSEVDVSRVSITQTNFPYIEIRKSTGGYSTFIRGTRVMVSTIIEYLLMGETPQTIVEDILPHLNLAQIRDAILYYSAFKAQIDRERRENTEEAGREYLRKHLGEEQFRKMTGG
ncbi:MAG: DUF433 domain-containing protein [Chloroflexota bacterium]